MSLRPKMDAYPKKNVMTPIGALAVGIFGLAVAGAVAVWPSSLSWALFCIATVTLSVALWAYIYFAVRDPDRLQTEDYRIQRAVIDKIPRIIDLAPEHVAPKDGRFVPPPSGMDA